MTTEERIGKLESDFKRFAEMLYLPTDNGSKETIWDRFFKSESVAPEPGDLTEGELNKADSYVENWFPDCKEWALRLVAEVRRRRKEERERERRIREIEAEREAAKSPLIPNPEYRPHEHEWIDGYDNSMGPIKRCAICKSERQKPEPAKSLFIRKDGTRFEEGICNFDKWDAKCTAFDAEYQTHRNGVRIAPNVYFER